MIHYYDLLLDLPVLPHHYVVGIHGLHSIHELELNLLVIPAVFQGEELKSSPALQQSHGDTCGKICQARQEQGHTRDQTRGFLGKQAFKPVRNFHQASRQPPPSQSTTSTKPVQLHSYIEWCPVPSPGTMVSRGLKAYINGAIESVQP